MLTSGMTEEPLDLSTLPKDVQVIAFVGPRESGKTTAASFAESFFGGEVLSFATPLKRAALQITGPLDARFTTSEKEAEIPGLGCSWRALCNFLGDGARRELGENIWLGPMQRQIDACAGLVFIDDLRYQNEADFIRSIGGVVVGVRRPVTWNKYPDCPIDKSAREVASSADYVIHNHKSLLTENAFVEDVIALVGALIKRA